MVILTIRSLFQIFSTPEFCLKGFNCRSKDRRLCFIEDILMFSLPRHYNLNLEFLELVVQNLISGFLQFYLYYQSRKVFLAGMSTLSNDFTTFFIFWYYSFKRDLWYAQFFSYLCHFENDILNSNNIMPFYLIFSFDI